ncbi:unnamed protein product, partial [Rangifer tarandus platyrhynchus]|uniref:Uncharacterized protein n=1 Tax=Rangifer tarandus platyrhynchus TaxID=3082113 RepID=A0AC59YGZ2_RANTA
MGGGQRGGLKGVARSRSLGAGLKGGLGLAARFSKTPRLRRPLLSDLSAPTPRSRPRDAGCAGRCQDARRCRRGRRGPGPLRGRVTEQAKPGAGSPMPPALRGTTLRPQARPPQSARGPPEGAGGGVPGHPALSPPLPGSASFSGSRFSTAASWAPPGVGGSRGPASAPFPSQAARRGAGLSASGQTTQPTDGRVSRRPDAGIPRKGSGFLQILLKGGC